MYIHIHVNIYIHVYICISSCGPGKRGLAGTWRKNHSRSLLVQIALDNGFFDEHPW